MPKAGYCKACEKNVWLNEDGSCQNGHSAPNISSVYETQPQKLAASEDIFFFEEARSQEPKEQQPETVASDPHSLILGEELPFSQSDIGLPTQITVKEEDWKPFFYTKLTQVYLLKKYGIDVELTETKTENPQTHLAISPKQRARHIYLVGGTGAGKTKALRGWVKQDIEKGRGLGVIDPHGDLISEILTDLDPKRWDDVILINPADDTRAVGFNPLEVPSGVKEYRLASELVTAFKKIWDLSDATAPRLLDILRNSLLTLIENKLTLVELPKLLYDKEYRRGLVSALKNEQIKEFWLKRFESWPQRERTLWIDSTLNKVNAFLIDPSIRAMLSRKGGGLNFRAIMDSNKILLINLSRGQLGEESAHLLGALFVTKIQMAAMSRAEIPEQERKPWHLYVDEFQNYATESFAEILSEARKYGLSLVMAHQNFTQLDPKLQDSVLANAHTQVYFSISSKDAELLVKEAFEVEGTKIKYLEVSYLKDGSGFRKRVFPLETEWFYPTDERGRALRGRPELLGHFGLSREDLGKLSKGQWGELKNVSTELWSRVWPNLYGISEHGGMHKLTDRDDEFDIRIRYADRESPTLEFAFGLSCARPEVLQKQYWSVEDERAACASRMANLPERQAFVRIKGKETKLIKTLEIEQLEVNEERAREIRNASNEKYALPIEEAPAETKSEPLQEEPPLSSDSEIE